MALTPWKSFRPLVARHLPRCPVFEIDDAVVEAGREFCREAHCWRQSGLSLLTTVAGQGAYVATLPTGAELLRVHAAFIGEDEVDVGLPGEGDDEAPTLRRSRWRIEAAPPAGLLLSPLPAVAGVAVVGTLSYIPTKTSTGLLDVIFDEHAYGIASGAVAMLAAQPGKDWSAPAIVTYHEGKFREAITTASNAAGPVRRRPLRVKPW